MLAKQSRRMLMLCLCREPISFVASSQIAKWLITNSKAAWHWLNWTVRARRPFWNSWSTDIHHVSLFRNCTICTRPICRRSWPAYNRRHFARRCFIPCAWTIVTSNLESQKCFSVLGNSWSSIASWNLIQKIWNWLLPMSRNGWFDRDGLNRLSVQYASSDVRSVVFYSSCRIWSLFLSLIRFSEKSNKISQ